MPLTISVSVRLFITAILIVLAICCLYKYICSLLVDCTYAEECIARWRKRGGNSKGPVYYESPAQDIYLTVIYHISTRLDVTRERIRFICEYLSAKLGDRKFEILCFVSPDYPACLLQAAPLRQQFPEVVPIGSSDLPLTIRGFTCAALKARGTFLVEAVYLEGELAKMPAGADSSYLSFLDPLPELPYFGDLDALVLVAAAKAAALALLRTVHVSEFGLAREIRLIADQKKLKINVEAKKMKSWNHSISYWVADKVAAGVIPWMYSWKLWSFR
jgi:hypothetical protein